MNVLSLFSGAGGFDLGFTQVGHKIIWANDIDIDCVNTYKSNIGNYIYQDDIASINIKDLPFADIVIGGFPCQGFSVANKYRSIDDDRNKLYLFFKKVIKFIQPQFFLAENVKGILSLDNGKAIIKIINDFKKCGYRVQYKLFNVADYGVPQTRQRVIIAGTRKDLSENHEYTFPKPTHNKSPKSKYVSEWISIEEALKNIPEPDTFHNLKNHIYSKYKITNRNFTGHRRTDPSKPSPTILARGNGKGGVCAIQHPKNHRRLSVRESALIQTFPINFEFYGSMSSMYRQVGNAVPVKFAKKLAQQLINN